MKIAPKLRKKLYEGVTITDEKQFSYYRTNSGQWYVDSKHTPGEVIKISAHEVPAWVLLEYTDFKKSQDMKTRFKTKQELNSTLSTGKIMLFWTSAKDYLFGLPWEGRNKSDGPISLYPELTDGDTFWNVSPEILTTNPHPYEGKSFKIRVTENDTLMVQKKAFALGCGWNGHNGSESEKPNTVSLFIRLSNSDIAFMENDNMSYFQNHHGIELTPQQFMDGDLPEKTQFEKDVDRMSKYYTLGVDPRDSAEAGEAKKTDAYIDKRGGIHIMSDDGGIMRLNSVQSICDRLYEYNLMSEADFKAKYSPKLKFKEWDVEVFDRFVKVGCQQFSKHKIKQFLEFAEAATRDQSAHGLSMDDVLGFLVDNKIKLGL